MISLMFKFYEEKILVIIKGNEVFFGNTLFGSQLSAINGLQLSYEGVLKEFPDLKDNPSWRLEAITRFKDKIKSYNTEDEKANYIIQDLRKHHYIPLYKQRKGFRVERLG